MGSTTKILPFPAVVDRASAVRRRRTMRTIAADALDRAGEHELAAMVRRDTRTIEEIVPAAVRALKTALDLEAAEFDARMEGGA